ncbi:endonuclease domain-containing protein [Candidatus Dojkabacteria bacterium]|jgi:very-short-patch-repair endonuclease|nr:endonuclease domain-containing protein [Candidatus Dojkabacteria bacterium]
MKCEICNLEVNGLKGLSIHLKKKHKYSDLDLKDYYDKYLKKETEGKCYFCVEEAIFLNFTKGYHRICKSKECLGKTRATGTIDFLKYKYDLNDVDAKNMQDERSKSRGQQIKKSFDKIYETDKDFHKKRSHNTKEFWLNKGFSEEESIKKSEEVMCMIHEKTFKKFKDDPEKYDDIRTSQLKYWLKKGFKYKIAKEKLKIRQRTFSLNICIEKYGDIEGRKRWLNRQQKWHSNYKKSNFSKISQKLFWSIYNNLSEDEKINIKFATLLNGEKDDSGSNNEQRLILDSVILPDFIDLRNNKIIEFDGVYYHRNNIENIKRDKKRTKMILKYGYTLLKVKENEYKQNIEKTIQKCIDFLKNNEKNE